MEIMPQNKRESLIYTIMMCFVMVLWMSMYNVALQYGTVNLEVVAAGWMGFPFAYLLACAATGSLPPAW